VDWNESAAYVARYVIRARPVWAVF